VEHRRRVGERKTGEKNGKQFNVLKGDNEFASKLLRLPPSPRLYDKSNKEVKVSNMVRGSLREGL
jgi:hypothetical protein